MYGSHRQEQAIWFAGKHNESIMTTKLPSFLVFCVNDDCPRGNMRAVLEGSLECIYQQDCTDSLSAKLDAPRQSSKKSRRDLLHPCQFLSDSFWNFVEFHRVGR